MVTDPYNKIKNTWYGAMPQRRRAIAEILRGRAADLSCVPDNDTDTSVSRVHNAYDNSMEDLPYEYRTQGDNHSENHSDDTVSDAADYQNGKPIRRVLTKHPMLTIIQKMSPDPLRRSSLAQRSLCQER